MQLIIKLAFLVLPLAVSPGMPSERSTQIGNHAADTVQETEWEYEIFALVRILGIAQSRIPDGGSSSGTIRKPSSFGGFRDNLDGDCKSDCVR